MKRSDSKRLMGEGNQQSPLKPAVDAHLSKSQTARTLMLELAKCEAKLGEVQKVYDKWNSIVSTSKLPEDLTAKSVLYDLRDALR